MQTAQQTGAVPTKPTKVPQIPSFPVSGGKDMQEVQPTCAVPTKPTKVHQIPAFPLKISQPQVNASQDVEPAANTENFLHTSYERCDQTSPLLKDEFVLFCCDQNKHEIDSQEIEARYQALLQLEARLEAKQMALNKQQRVLSVLAQQLQVSAQRQDILLTARGARPDTARAKSGEGPSDEKMRSRTDVVDARESDDESAAAEIAEEYDTDWAEVVQDYLILPVPEEFKVSEDTDNNLLISKNFFSVANGAKA